MENINWICKAKTVNNNIVWMCSPKIKEHFEATTNTVQLFSAANYGGNSSSFGIGRYTNSQLDKIGPKALQSIKVPSGLVALLYQNADFTGYGKAITGENSDLSKVTDSKNTGFNWSNQMQSLIVQPHVALPTSISDSMPKISLVASDPNSFITAISGAKLTRIQDSSYLYVDPNNPDNIFWYNAGDLQIIPPFSMANISGIHLWLDGSDPAGNGTPPADGTKVTTWTDKSSNKFNAASANGNPTYNAATKSIKFDGGSAYNLPNGSLPYNNSPYSIFIIVSTVNPGPPGWYLSGGSGQVLGSAFNANALSHSWANGGSELWRQGPVRPISPNKPVIVLLSYNSSDRMLTLDGTLAGSDKAGVINNDQNRNVIGYSPVYGQNLNGNIYEILIFNDYLADTQRQMIEGYLAWKWGLQSNLPDNHPFKSGAPSGSTAFPKIPKFFLANIEQPKPRSQIHFVSMSSDGKNMVAQGENLPTVLSTDYGKTWKRIHNANFDDWHYQSHLVISDQGQILINTQNHGNFFSSDLGVTFKEVCEKSANSALSVCSRDGKMWYVPLSGNHIWKSTDSGNTFQKLPRIPGKGDLTCVCCTDDGNTVYMCTANGYDGHIYKSTDGANNWVKINKEKNPRGGGLEGNGTWSRLCCSGDGTIVLGVNMDPLVLMVSSDSGNTWNDINPPGNRVSPFASIALSKDGSTIVIGCSQPMTLLKSTNLGKTWTQLPKSGLEIYNYYYNLAISRDGSTLAATTYTSDKGKLAILS